MKKIKILSLVLALLMLLPLMFSACSKGEKKNEDNGGGKQQTNTDAVYDAEIHDLHGHEFWFIVRELGKYQHLTVNEVYAEELNGDKVNDAVYKRNSYLESTYNCTIHEDRVEKPHEAVKEQLLAGEYQYDYIYTGVRNLRPLSASNLLVDFKELQNVHLEKTWWDQNAINGFAIADKAFYVTGEGGTLDERSSWILFFNKDILEKCHLELPYQMVREGKWTIDKMYEYVDASWDDLDGNGVIEIGKDRFGYIGEPVNNWMHVAACGLRLSRVTASGEIEIPATINQEILAAWDALKPLLTTEHRLVADSGTQFRAGHGTFFGILSGAILNMSKTETLNFGVLPLPKLNEEQENYWTSMNSSWCYGYAIPVTTDNATDAAENGFESGSEQAGYFLEAFFFQSAGTLSAAYYDQVVKHQVIKDEESVDMMDIALKNKVYDPVVIFDFGKIGTTLFSQTGSNGGKAGDNGTAAKGSDVNYDTLVSTYESRVNSARKALKNYIDYITNEDD